MTRNSCPMFCRPGVGRLPFLGITAIWLTVACALALPLQTGAQERPTLGSPDSLTVRSVELRQVSFEKPARVGFGEEARYYDRAVEIRLVVDPFFEGDLEPALWVGDEEIRGHRILRRPDHFVLAFDAFEPQKLEAGACIWVGTTRPSRETCAFTYEPSRIVDGQPLVEEPLATSGKPDPRQWDRDDQDGGQCAAKLPPIGPADYYGYELALYDPQDHRIEQLQPGDSLAVEISNIPPLRQNKLRVIDDQGQEWAYARLTADREGRVGRTLLWYNTGVIGTTSRDLGYRPDPAFVTFEEAFQYWNFHQPSLEILDDDGRSIDRVPLPIARSRTEPLVYPSNAKGVLMNSMQVGRDPFFVTGTHFPAGSTVLLFVVENRYSWQEGDVFQDLTGPGLASDVTVVRLAAGQTDFTVQPWPDQLQRTGSFDIITRVVTSSPDPRSLNTQVQAFSSADLVAFSADTAVNLFDIINGHIVMEIAGRRLDDLPWYDSSWFEFADVFEKGETVYGAVDPTDFPPSHTGGEYAAYFVVEAQPAAYWDAASPALVDISGPGMSSQPEIALVKYSCINLTRTAIWPDADPPGCLSDYQVIVDFGATPATSSGTYVFDNVYNKGTDFIDRYPEPGFTVVDPPAECCLYSIGQQDHYDDVATGSDPNRAFDLTSLGFPLVRNWFTIRYPAQSPGGVGASLPSGTDRYPVVLFLHGRHPTCASGTAFNPSCPAADRIASHRGYDYILDSLAKQGYIAISVDAYDIQPSNSTNNYEARGILILEHLNRMEDWDLNGTDPWGGMFQNRIDMSRIAIVGHSRGGEGVVAAAELDVTLSGTYGHGIDAVIAIAPTDQQVGTKWEVLHTPYLLLVGAADGDVWNLQGFRPWDDSFPTGSSPQFEKSLAYVHGANHNFWNTVWTPGSGDPYASDDGASYTGPRLTAAEQRETGLTPITGFVHQHLGGVGEYRQIFTGKLPISTMPNDSMHWSYQHPDHLTADDYENGNTTLNTLAGGVSYPGSLSVSEGSVGSCSFHPSSNGTAGVTWTGAGDIYESVLPVGQRDVSGYSHLSFRVTQVPDGGTLNPVGADKTLIVRLVDGDGDSRKALTSDFRDIPYPYERSATNRPCQMKGVRIPLRTFAMNNSGVDLDDIVRVEIEFPGTGKVAIDDLQFTQ